MRPPAWLGALPMLALLSGGQAAAQSVIMALVLVAMLAVYLLILRKRGERV